MRFFLGAFGDAGHAFPMLALGEALRDRGHTVALETWKKWREPVEAAGMEFVAAPEYHVFPTRERPMKPYEAVVHAARTTRDAIREFAPDAVVADILTAAPALAGELAGLPVATLVPHVHPHLPPGFPPYSIGARLPRTRLGTAFWRPWDRLVGIGLERGRRDYNDCRARLGLPPLPYLHTGLSRSLTLVATLPALEYPRVWPPWIRIVGPLMWEPPGERIDPPPAARANTAPSDVHRGSASSAPAAMRRRTTSSAPAAMRRRTTSSAPAAMRRRTTSSAPAAMRRRTTSSAPAAMRWRSASSTTAPPGGRSSAPVAAEDPVVLIAPSTAQDREHRLLRAALAGLADEPVRVIATWNGRDPDPPIPVPANAVLVPWLSYAKTMPACDLVVCHGGHGTLVRALATGCPVVVCPAGGDMAENAARVDRAGAGIRLAPRFCTPWGVRLAVTRALTTPSLRTRAAEIARWAADHPAGPIAAAELERWATSA